MSIIRRQDTNGTKPLLAVGEFGYDNYPAGGDAGRVYVGDGTNNVPMAKKSETDTLTTDLGNLTTTVTENDLAVRAFAVSMAIGLG